MNLTLNKNENKESESVSEIKARPERLSRYRQLKQDGSTNYRKFEQAGTRDKLLLILNFVFFILVGSVMQVHTTGIMEYACLASVVILTGYMVYDTFKNNEIGGNFWRTGIVGLFAGGLAMHVSFLAEFLAKL